MTNEKKVFKKTYTVEERIAYYRNRIEHASRRIEALEKEQIKEWVKNLRQERREELLQLLEIEKKNA